MWKQFAHSQEKTDGITVMESRFWQTSVMLMYAAGHSPDGVLESNRRVVEAIRPLNPALICFEIHPLREFIQRTIQIKEAEWQKEQLPGTWAGHIFSAFSLLFPYWFSGFGSSVSLAFFDSP